jgi:hypothetical protein
MFRNLPRVIVRAISCPACGAIPGERCIGARSKPRESNHMERVLAAERRVAECARRPKLNYASQPR